MAMYMACGPGSRHHGGLGSWQRRAGSSASSGETLLIKLKAMGFTSKSVIFKVQQKTGVGGGRRAILPEEGKRKRWLGVRV